MGSTSSRNRAGGLVILVDRVRRFLGSGLWGCGLLVDDWVSGV